MLFLGWACTEEDNDVFVLSEEVLYESGDQIRLLGRLISDQAVKVDDHGFYLSKDAAFSSPIINSLGPKDGPGRFIGLISGLESGQEYFVKSFISIAGQISFGNVIQAKTLTTQLETFSPVFGAKDQEMVISGKNFTTDTKVFFGTVEAQIIDISFDTKIRVKIPAPKDGVKVPVIIQSQGAKLEFPELFEYRVGTYQVISTYPDPVRLYDNIFFQQGGELFIGLGSDRRISLLDHFQKYNISSNTWEKVPFPGTPRSFAFSTNNYLGGGINASGLNINSNSSFWRITPGGFDELPDLLFNSRESIAFELNSNLYLLGSKPSSEAIFRKYDPISKSWSTLPSPPENFNAENVHFIYNGKAYIIASNKTVWEYNPAAGWAVVTVFPGDIGEGYGMGKVIGSKAYIGLYRRSNEMWELDLNTFEWKPKNPVSGLPQSLLVGHFERNGIIYFMRVPDIAIVGSFPMELYKFDPNGF